MSQTVDLYIITVYNVYNSKKHLESLVYNSGVIVRFLPRNMYFVVNKNNYGFICIFMMEVYLD